MAILTTTLMDFPRATGSPILKLKAILKARWRETMKDSETPIPRLTDFPRAIQKGSPRVKEKRFRRCSGFRMGFRMARETPTRWWKVIPRVIQRDWRSVMDSRIPMWMDFPMDWLRERVRETGT